MGSSNKVRRLLCPSKGKENTGVLRKAQRRLVACRALKVKPVRLPRSEEKGTELKVRTRRLRAPRPAAELALLLAKANRKDKTGARRARLHLARSKTCSRFAVRSAVEAGVSAATTSATRAVLHRNWRPPRPPLQLLYNSSAIWTAFSAAPLSN
jgi:dTDP-4-dehydrorhamnose reductase